MIFVTGATGNIGQEVVRELIKMKQPVQAAAINDMDAERNPDGVEISIFNFNESSSYQSALEGVRKVFLMRPPQILNMENTLNPIVDYAKNVGVKQVVFVSLLGIEENPRVPHYAAGQHIKSCCIDYTFLRPSFFMQNLNTTHRMEILEKDEIFLPVGKARTSFIDTRDFGAVAARVLTDEGHSGTAYDLTCGEALDYYQVAEIFSRVLGRKITYRNPSIPAFIWFSWRRGVPIKLIMVMVFLYKATRDGSADVVTDDVNHLLGRPPISFQQYVEDYAEVWLKD